MLRLNSVGRATLTVANTAVVVAWLSGDLVKAPHTILLSGAGATKPTSVPGKGQLTFPAATAFTSGEVLVLPDGPLTPGGLIADVDSVIKTTTGTTVRYHKGGLLDAFSELDMTTQVPLTTPIGSAARQGSNYRANDVTPINGTISKDITQSKNFTLGKNPSVTAGVTFNFHPSMTVVITIHTAAIFPVGVKVYDAVDGRTSLDATVTASGSWGGSATYPLGDAVLGAIELGPVTVVPELSSSLNVAVHASASASIERSITENAHVGFSVTAGTSGVSTTGDSNNGFSKPTINSNSAPSFSAQATASASVAFKFDLAIEGLAGPDAEADIGVAFTVDPGASPWWHVDASGGFKIGVNLNALNISLLNKLLGAVHIPNDPSWQLGHLGPYRLAAAGGSLGGPTGGTGGSAGPTGGTGGGSGPGVVGGSSVGPVPAGSYAETDGGVSRTWTNPSNGGGTQGPSIAPDQTVGIACKVQGLTVTDGNSWWYQISSSPWNSDYFVSADAFFNNGQTSGSLLGTPFVDASVPDCHGSGSGSGSGSNQLTGTAETTGGQANTWADYSNAGGAQGPGIASNQTVLVACKLPGFKVADGNTWWYQIASSPWNDQFYVSADAFYNNGQTSGSLLGTPFVDSAIPDCGAGGGAPPPPPGTVTETTGGVTHTWTNYGNAGGTQGASIATNASVQITCRLTGFQVADGNTWWYQVASSPWSNAYYASADAFYNNGQTSGSLQGTPFYDPAVPVCGSGPPPPPPPTWAETTGGVAHTWTNYTNAGGTQGPSIASNQTVQIACRLTGFQVADGNTWWYRIASSPWNNAYYVSADAFYNNGQTSGSLIGTPFVDTAVASC